MLNSGIERVVVIVGLSLFFFLCFFNYYFCLKCGRDNYKITMYWQFDTPSFDFTIAFGLLLIVIQYGGAWLSIFISP